LRHPLSLPIGFLNSTVKIDAHADAIGNDVSFQQLLARKEKIGLNK